MKIVIVIGCPGAGKSRFSRLLHEKTGLPLYHLDTIWHNPDKTIINRDEFDSQLMKILHSDEWIVDGCYLRTLPIRMKYCDTVFFLDYTVEDCMAGAIDRLGKQRDDMPWNEETLDDIFRQSIIDFPVAQRPRIVSEIENFNGTIMIFKCRKDVDDYLRSF